MQIPLSRVRARLQMPPVGASHKPGYHSSSPSPLPLPEESRPPRISQKWTFHQRPGGGRLTGQRTWVGPFPHPYPPALWAAHPSFTSGPTQLSSYPSAAGMERGVSLPPWTAPASAQQGLAFSPEESAAEATTAPRDSWLSCSQGRGAHSLSGEEARNV